MPDLIRVGRVLHEDDGYITISVAKSLDTELHLNEGDQFLSLVFVHSEGEGQPATPWLPWEA